ncbi:hypothetical protein J6590_087572 [Homalodisca vitripennis]|nr:hypothetical protein J6590_087572 [Homalodisca vitripennis]
MLAGLSKLDNLLGKPATTYNDFCDSGYEAIACAGCSENVLLIGDFNLPNMDWSACDMRHDSEASRSLINLASFHNLQQMNYTSNFRGVYLDLVFHPCLCGVPSSGRTNLGRCTPFGALHLFEPRNGPFLCQRKTCP